MNVEVFEFCKGTVQLRSCCYIGIIYITGRLNPDPSQLSCQTLDQKSENCSVSTIRKFSLRPRYPTV